MWVCKGVGVRWTVCHGCLRMVREGGAVRAGGPACLCVQKECFQIGRDEQLLYTPGARAPREKKGRLRGVKDGRMGHAAHGRRTAGVPEAFGMAQRPKVLAAPQQQDTCNRLAGRVLDPRCTLCTLSALLLSWRGAPLFRQLPRSCPGLLQYHTLPLPHQLPPELPPARQCLWHAC